MKANSQIAQLIAEADDLPSLPVVTQKIIQLTFDPEKALSDVAKLVSSDAALSLRFLKIVNSSYYGFSKEIKDINQAVSILGILAIRNIAITLSLFDVFPIKHSPEYSNLFKQALTTAVAADFISQIGKNRTHPDVFLSALLINVGAMLLMRYLPNKYNKILYAAHEYGIEELAMERMVLNSDRVQIGLAVCKRWNLPRVICNSIKHAYNISDVDESNYSSEEKQLFKVIYLGRIVGDIYWAANKTYKISVFRRTANILLGMEEKEAMDILSSIPHLIEQTGFLNLQNELESIPTFQKITMMGDEELRQHHIRSEHLYRKYLVTREKLMAETKTKKVLQIELDKSRKLIQKFAAVLKKQNQ